MAIIEVKAYRCDRCTHVWLPRIDTLPKMCPSCKSPYWNAPREFPYGKKKAKKRRKSGTVVDK